MPNRNRHITDYPLYCRRNRVLSPIKCVVCRTVIKVGEWYYQHSGHETHKDCVQLQSYDLHNHHTKRG
jgi:hypothetical protein